MLGGWRVAVLPVRGGQLALVLGCCGGGRCRRHGKVMPVTAGCGRGHSRVVQRRRESPVYPTADAGKGVVEWRLVMVVVSELRNEIVKKKTLMNVQRK